MFLAILDDETLVVGRHALAREVVAPYLICLSFDLPVLSKWGNLCLNLRHTPACGQRRVTLAPLPILSFRLILIQVYTKVFACFYCQLIFCPCQGLDLCEIIFFAPLQRLFVTIA